MKDSQKGPIPFGFIDPPSPFDTMQTLLDWQMTVESWPDTDPHKAEYLAAAKKMVADRAEMERARG